MPKDNSKRSEDVRAPAKWSFWLQWVVVTAVVWAALFGLAESVSEGEALYESWHMEMDSIAIARRVIQMFWVAGLPVGLAQWLVLRQRVSRSAWWILASGAGWIADLRRTLIGRVVHPAKGENRKEHIFPAHVERGGPGKAATEQPSLSSSFPRSRTRAGMVEPN